MQDTSLGALVGSKAAVRWLRRATPRKLGAAWSSLGLLRQFGRDVLKDRIGARHAHFNAIRYGEPHGFAGMGLLYSSRLDRRKDYLRAIAWRPIIVMGSRENSWLPLLDFPRMKSGK